MSDVKMDVMQGPGDLLGKILKVRLAIQKAGVVATGRYLDEHYYRISDFIMLATKACSEHGICPIFSYDGDTKFYKMVVSDIATGAFVIFVLPAVKNEEVDIQAVGAICSYSRRYLWYMFLELPINDYIIAKEGDVGLKKIDNSTTLRSNLKGYEPGFIERVMEAFNSADEAGKKKIYKEVLYNLNELQGHYGQTENGLNDRLVVITKGEHNEAGIKI